MLRIAAFWCAIFGGAIFGGGLAGGGIAGVVWADDPLPSWNDGPAKEAIIAFVASVTTENSEDFVPPLDRVAVFNGDGTLWPARPLPVRIVFALEELRRLAPTHSPWQNNPQIVAAMAGEVSTISPELMRSLQTIAGAAHAGMTADQYELAVLQWISGARHPALQRPYRQVIYQPMREVLDYFRAHDFKTYIVPTEGAEFVRVWARQIYGLPPEETIGISVPLEFVIRDGVPVLVKDAEIHLPDDAEAKPVTIHRHVGRRPIAAFGSSDDDQAMLWWTTVGRSPALGVIIPLTQTTVTEANVPPSIRDDQRMRVIAEAPQRDWVVVDPATDWNPTYPPNNPQDESVSNPSDSALKNTAWLVEDINERGVVDRAQTTIQFDGEGKVFGSTAVNRYNGKVTIDQDKLSFGPMMTTRRAGPPALMDQEKKFVEALSRVQSFRIEDTGLLHLQDASGKTVIRASRMQDPQP